MDTANSYREARACRKLVANASIKIEEATLDGTTFSLKIRTTLGAIVGYGNVNPDACNEGWTLNGKPIPMKDWPDIDVVTPLTPNTDGYWHRLSTLVSQLEEWINNLVERQG